MIVTLATYEIVIVVIVIFDYVIFGVCINMNLYLLKCMFITCLCRLGLRLGRSIADG